MDPAELDIAIGELEIRVERLRSLYEQYFLGIEKIEPQVARKDVDRRVWTLRREKIRNTAKRFKLQTIIQRYNTFQQYWQRICREIERGTYRRHVLRAERATATVSDAVAQQSKDKAAAERKGASEAAEAASDQLADMLARDVDAEQEFARAVADAQHPQQGTHSPRRGLGALDLELEGIDTADAALRPATPSLDPSARRPAGDSPEPKRPANVLASLGKRPTGSDEGAGRLAAGPPPTRVRPRAQVPERSARQPPLVASKDQRPAPTGGPADAKMAGPAALVPQKPQVAKAGLTDQRIAELHRQLVATKHRTRETGKVSVNGLAKSLRAAESKLRKQHKDRRIDFDVIIKNGKAVVKPIVR